MRNSALALLQYVPDKVALSTRFQYWQVEALLNQAATLTEQCLADVRDYSSLDYAWREFDLELTAQERQLQLEAGRKFFERQKATVERRQTYFANTRGFFDNIIRQSEKLYNFKDGNGNGQGAVQGFPGWTRAEIALEEKRIEAHSREAEADVLGRQAQWAQADIDYDAGLIEARRQVLVAKRELTQPGGPFALEAQRDAAMARVERNYQDALNRAVFAHEGLQKIYGHDAGEPAFANGAVAARGATLHAVVTHLANWIRNSVEWIVAHQQLEQQFSQVVSLRQLLGDSWWDIHNARTESVAVKFEVPPALWAGYENVRLRGISAFVLGEVSRPWRLVARVPSSAYYVRNGRQETNAQTNAAPCTLGRVRHLQATRAPETCGEVTLWNLSPLAAKGSQWRLEIYHPYDEAFSSLEDVLLELNCVARATAVQGVAGALS